ncbi:protoporphyrinogen oxidase [Granulicella cerasi]|uniref:Coproporphyrinogen III oxidase n=1 Tax=Granulicella cerasi TaxID=741063 RepID=A0ABW1Z847_9BACT|nr:protoporphyrinogen oxidase [Granulicella cerasi]
MKRIAILGGGISGLAAAYELERARLAGAAIDWQLYEATDRLGGILDTRLEDTPAGRFVLEGGPDGWVSEKPWLRELAIELGLEDELIASNDATRKTYILKGSELIPIPDGMRMMVPTDLSVMEGSPLFSEEAKRAYTAETMRADELKATAPAADESVASFVLRHFGEEVLTTLAAPLLAGVFGGDVRKLSVRSVMPQFVAMEREHGSLILALQAKQREHGDRPRQTIFTSLRNGMGSLVSALVAKLPPERIHLNQRTWLIDDSGEWIVRAGNSSTHRGMLASYASRSHGDLMEPASEIIVATPVDVTRELFAPLIHKRASKLLPTDASSAILVAFGWTAEQAQSFTVPAGFGYLVPPDGDASKLMACTFVDGKFPHRAPEGARIIRAFFGGKAADRLQEANDVQIAAEALAQLTPVLGTLPEPIHTYVRRWPRSLPQYEVGHLERMDELETLVAKRPGIHLLGNSYRGVGMPDLIRDARALARKLTT